MSGQSQIETLLRDLEDKILRIKKRYYALEAYLNELEKVTGGKRFKIKNDIVHQMVSDSFEMLIIDLASLFRGMCQPGGFFGQLKLHAARLRKTSYRKIDVTEPNIIENPQMPLSAAETEQLKRSIKMDTQKYVAKGIEESLDELFPELKGLAEKKANHDHIDALKDKFWEWAEELVRSRDSYHAHKYEHKDRNDPGDAKDISLKDIGAHFQRLERMINAIRSVATASSFSYSDMNFASCEETAKDLVDLVVMGRFNEIFSRFGVPKVLERMPEVARYYYLYREQFYKANPSPFGLQPKKDSEK